jgi:hypothetical protein
LKKKKTLLYSVRRALSLHALLTIYSLQTILAHLIPGTDTDRLEQLF